MFRYTDDPLADHAAYEAELARLEKQVPKCCDGCHPIMEDFYYELHDERPICAEHLERHKVQNDDGHTHVCDYCGGTITDDSYYRNDDEEIFCKACTEKHFRKDFVVD